LTAHLAAYFQRNAGSWIDAKDLLSIAGNCGWRSRLSELRRRPYHMVISNRLRRCRAENGNVFVISEYKFEPHAFPNKPEGLDDDGFTLQPPSAK
jgi:hypothetical protein